MWGILWSLWGIFMPKLVKEKSDSEVRSLKHKIRNGKPTKAKHFVGGVNGLALICKPPEGDSTQGSRYWVLFYSLDGRRLEKNFGSYPTIKTAQARALAREWREKLHKGVDPKLEEVETARSRRKRLASEVTFEQFAHQWFEIQLEKKANKADVKKLFNRVKKYAFPKLANKPLLDIGYEDVAKVLRPIWKDHHATAKKVKQAIKRIFDLANAQELLPVQKNPAVWSGGLQEFLDAPSEFYEPQNFAALHYSEIPAFIERLKTTERVASPALLFAILTAARSQQVRSAQWDHIDWENSLWICPKSVMKAKREHAVPLSGAALDVLRMQPGYGTQKGLIFPAAQGGEMHDAYLSREIMRLGYPQEATTVHGFRATFKTWATEHKYDDALSEIALAHSLGPQEKRAYIRTDMVNLRRPMMEAWADQCMTMPPSGDNVIDLGVRRKAN